MKHSKLYYLTHPSVTIPILLAMVSDKYAIQTQWKKSMDYPLNLDNPRTYNEKIQWLKLYDRRPEYTQMVDKVGAKEFAAKRIGEQYIIPTIGVWNRPEDIPWDELPNQFVIKLTHDSGSVIICKEKKNLNIQEVCTKLSKGLKQDYYRVCREWPYKNVKHRIIVEQYMVDESGYELKDYKFFCFNGEPKIMFIASDREVEGEEIKMDFFDMNFRLLPFNKGGHKNAPITPVKPKCFEQMVELARKLSDGIPHVRVDFYNINGHIYFGELTFYSGSGFVRHEPMEWDEKIGELLTLPNKQ